MGLIIKKLNADGVSFRLPEDVLNEMTKYYLLCDEAEVRAYTSVIHVIYRHGNYVSFTFPFVKLLQIKTG